MPKLQGEGWDEWIFRQSVEVGTRNDVVDRWGSWWLVCMRVVYGLEAADGSVKCAGCSNRTTSLNAFLYISREELHI
jgi:hypothetical protein